MGFEFKWLSVMNEPSGKPLKLASWWIPHPNGGEKTVVLIHGYADAKVGSIAWAPTWRSLGYHILAIDLRAHGESEGDYTTAGVLERYDLDQLLNQIKAEKPQQTQEIVLFGISMGGLVALATAELRNDIAAVVVDGAILSFCHGVRRHFDIFLLPLPKFFPITFALAKWLTQADFDQIQPARIISSLKTPIFVIHAGEDRFVLPEDANQIESAIQSRPAEFPISEFWPVPDVPHLMVLPADAEAYRERIDQFLRKARTGFASHQPHVIS